MPVMQFINEKTDHPLIIHIFPETVNKKATVAVYEDSKICTVNVPANENLTEIIIEKI